MTLKDDYKLKHTVEIVAASELLMDNARNSYERGPYRAVRLLAPRYRGARGDRSLLSTHSRTTRRTPSVP